MHKVTGAASTTACWTTRVYATAFPPLRSPPWRAATNNAPVAVADSYTRAGHGSCPGCTRRAGDTDADANPLTAVLNATSATASLSLAANGGFTYTPTDGYSGPDSFTYKPTMGIDKPVVVSLTVTAAPAATLVGWWQMENNAQDSSTYANHGSLVGSPTFVPGQIGQAISLKRHEPEHFSSRRQQPRPDHDHDDRCLDQTCWSCCCHTGPC